MLRKDLPIRNDLMDGTVGKGGTITVYANPIIAAVRSNLGGSPGGAVIPPQLPNITTDGLVLYVDASSSDSYPGSGSTWFDLANPYNGAIVGATYQSTNGGEFNFSGTDQYINFGENINFNSIFAGANKKFTISAWVRFDSLSTLQTIVSKSGDTNQSEDNRQLVYRVTDVSGTPRLDLLVYYSLATPLSYRRYHASNIAIATNTYYNLVAVYDGSLSEANRFNFYINGYLTEKTLSGTAGSQGFIQNSPARLAAGASIGSASANNPVGELDGQISNIMIYGKVLSADEVLENYYAMSSRFG